MNKRVPKTLNECIAPDKVSSNLWSWSERIEKGGKIILGILIAVGLFDGISSGIKEGELAGWISALIDFAIYGIIAAVEYCVTKAVSLLLGALASIVQNTNISANIALYEVTPKAGDGWKEEPPHSKKKTVNPQKTAKEKEKDEFHEIECVACGETLRVHKKTNTIKCPFCGVAYDLNPEE